MRNYDEILNEMKEKYKELSKVDVLEGSDIDIRLRVLAGELYALFARLDYIERQSFFATAEGEYLERHAMELGLERRKAAKARGEITFRLKEPLDYILNIPAGAVCAAGDSLRFITTDACNIAPGMLSATAPCEAEEGGTEYNTAENTVTTIVSASSVIDSVNNSQMFTGGTDIESDEKLRERLIDFCSFIPSGANEEFYKNLIYSVGGISSVSVSSSDKGVVDIYVWGKGEAASESLISELTAVCNENKYIGTLINVQNAGIYEYSLFINVTPDACSIETARQAIIDAAQVYFESLNIGDPVYKGTLGAYLLANTPIKNYSFPSALSDYSGTPSVMPVLKSVEVNEI